MTEEVPVESSIEIAGHIRQKRRRKALNRALPREIVRHELPESERICRTFAQQLDRNAILTRGQS